jgi:methyl-accepting chemotaxis protein
MQQASQYGYVMNFFKLLNECSNVEQVASLFFEAMDYFQLKACLMTKLPTLKYWEHDLLDVSPIEKNVFELLAPKSRLYEFQNRMIVNDKHVSFIIKNMPSDPEAAGQAKDFTAALVEGMESKILDLQLQAGIVNAAERLAQNVSTIKQAIFDHNRVISEVMSDMLTDISSSYHELEMTEQQETFLSEIVEEGVGKLGEADNLLYDLQTSLEELLDDMEEIKKEAINQQKESAPVSNNDIEFF